MTTAILVLCLKHVIACLVGVALVCGFIYIRYNFFSDWKKKVTAE